MKSDEESIREAIEALAARLNAENVTDADNKARRFIWDLHRNGWRPGVRPPAPPIEPYTGERAADPKARVAELKAIARAATKPTEYEETQP